MFIGFHFITWHFFTQKILSGNNNGDLARLAYLPQFKQERDFIDDLPRRHIEFSEFKGGNVDVLTIGDSFSNGIGGGKNRFYQDYLASKQNVNVLNVSPYLFDATDPGNPFDTLILFLNSGVIDDIKPKYILIESVERFACKRSNNVKFDIAKNKKELLDYYQNVKTKTGTTLPEITFINNGNLKYYWYNYKKEYGANLLNDVVIAKLNKKMFSDVEGNTLLFLVDELKVIKNDYQLCADELNNNLNVLSEILIKKNIKLYFMLVVDKYNLYSDFIDNNLFGKSKLFELLRNKDKKYQFIDTKKILAEELYKNGTADLFYVDDSHWSWKASELIFTKASVQ